MKTISITLSLLLVGTMSNAFAADLTYADCLMNVPQISHMTYDQCIKKIKPIIVEPTYNEKMQAEKAAAKIKYDQCIKGIPTTKTFAEKAVMVKNCNTKSKSYTLELASVTEYKLRQKDRILVCEHQYSSWLWLKEHNINIPSYGGQNKCVKLYNDPLWKYTGQDRYDKLIALYIKYWGR